MESMNSTFIASLSAVAALGSGLMAGTFFAFSAFVMPALNRIPSSQGIAAMQSINVAVINPWFLGVFGGTAALSLVLMFLALLGRTDHCAIYILIGGGLYLLGTIAVTVIFNVPLNDSLAPVKPESEPGTQTWVHYVGTWTAWNPLRTAGSLLSAASFILAAR
jgi:uncharacterized membrane protein